MGKKKFSTKIETYIIKEYISGFSTTEIAKKYECSNVTIFNILKRNNIPLRTVSEGNSLKWKNKHFRENQINKRIGKPSGAKGKRWTVSHKINKPNLIGDKNPNWKNGKTKLSNKIKCLYEYKEWRKKIFERDNYTCVLCGEKSSKGSKIILNADHIKPFSIILEENKILTIKDALKCKELFDTNNGRTLCLNCHKNTETWGLNPAKSNEI